MGLFEDKKYNEMDWLSQAVEPIISSLNDELAKLPARFELTFSDIAYLQTASGYYSSSLYAQQMIKYCLKKQGIPDYNVNDRIVKLYKVVCEGDDVTGYLTIDYVNNTLDGKVCLVKTKDHFDEKELLSFMGENGYEELMKLRTLHATPPVDRVNEIIELLGEHSLLKSKSISNKIMGIARSYMTTMQENKWNLRNVDLSDKIGHWIALYLKNGNLAALTNFCKLKVMTHEKAPIYSIEEEAVD